MDSSLADALRDRYVLGRELGRGGMATVYLARDLKHDRPVALKVLHRELAATLGPERFLREIRLAARLQHPHILSVHDSGEDAGRLWFVMPYVEGESLRDRLRREKQLPVDESLRITREAAQALHYAHQHGVIHRDIKPENLLLTEDGSTLVADFGVARALTGGEERLTETGLAVGTPTYMSPEQASGTRELDARSDVYALGTVLYEMLAGEPPYTGPTAQMIIARRLTESPRPLGAVRQSVSAGVEQAVTRALARSPADRFSSAAEFARALVAPEISTPTRHRRPATAAALGLGLTIGLGLLFGWLRGHSGREGADVGVTRVAVLPFENLGRAEDEYFADGVTDAIRGKLTALPGLRVTARSSSTQYKGSTRSPREIGEELGVDYLLTGTVRWQKSETGQSRVQVSPELIEASSSAAEWQEAFDAGLTDVFQVQGQIAGHVAEALGVALAGPERERLEERPTGSLAAYDAYLKGEQVSSALGVAAPVPVRRAAEYYAEAVALDSGFALAWSQLSRAHSVIYFNGTPTPEGAATAERAARQAVELAPGRAEGYLALGNYYTNVRADHTRALTEYAKGRRLAPNNADLLTATGLAEQRLGRWEAALEHLDQARMLDPRSGFAARRYALTLLWLRRHPEAIAAYDRTLVVDPTNVAALQQKAMVHLALGDLDAARGVLRAPPEEMDSTTLVAYVATYWDLSWLLDDAQQRHLLRLSPGAFDGNRAQWGIALAQAHAYRGDEALASAYADSARADFERQLRLTPDDAQSHALNGLALGYLGRKAESLHEGERALALQPATRDAWIGPYLQHLLARICLLVGERERALDLLEPLLDVPYYLSPGWLRVDPTFAPLRGHPRFERLAGGTISHVGGAPARAVAR